MRVRWLLGGVAAACALVAGCSTVVDGSGSTGSGVASGGSTAFPSPSGAVVTTAGNSPASSPVAAPSSSAVANVTGCPHVEFPTAKLTYDCYASLGPPKSGTVWPLVESQTVESTTGWVMEEGAGHWGPPAGDSLGAIVATVRSRMVSNGSYLASPTVATVSDKDTTINGAKAHVLQCTITLNTAAAQKRGTKVRAEHLWIVAVEVASNDVSLWYASVPDLAKQYWAKIPSIITTIKVKG